MMAITADAEDFVARAAERLRPEPPAGTNLSGHHDADSTSDRWHGHKGDHELNGGPVLPAGSLKPAAVLVPVIMRSEGAMVLFTQRAPDLRAHSGQIAFPGGRMDETDESPLHTALREAEEEIGLAPSLVRPIGYLDPYLTSTNYLVMPVVGLLPPAFGLVLNPAEVAEVFEVPLGFLMDAVNHQIHSRPWKGTTRQYYAMPFGERYIWGATAGIVRNLYDRLYGT